MQAILSLNSTMSSRKRSLYLIQQMLVTSRLALVYLLMRRGIFLMHVLAIMLLLLKLSHAIIQMLT